VAFTSGVDVFLDKLALFEFPILIGVDYELVYFPIERLPEARVRVWEYQGETE
jgi:hypothetical protein